jgi:hypothetical protein
LAFGMVWLCPLSFGGRRKLYDILLYRGFRSLKDQEN